MSVLLAKEIYACMGTEARLLRVEERKSEEVGRTHADNLFTKTGSEAEERVCDCTVSGGA